MSNATELLRRALEKFDAGLDGWSDLIEDIRAYLDAEKEAEPVINKKALLKKILKIPRRIEPLGGQRTSYVQLDEVVGWIEEHEKLHPPKPEPEAEPVAFISQYKLDGLISGSNGESSSVYRREFYGYDVPLFLHPPRPEPARKPITYEQVEEELEIHKYRDMPEYVNGFLSGISFAERHYGIGGDDE